MFILRRRLLSKYAQDLSSLRTGIEGKIEGVRREWETEGIGEERREGEKEKYNVI